MATIHQKTPRSGKLLHNYGSVLKEKILQRMNRKVLVAKEF